MIFPSSQTTYKVSLLPIARLGAALLLLLSCAALVVVPREASAQSNRLKEKKQLESARTELQQKLRALKKDISKTESAKEKASDALEDSEQAISDTNRSLRELHVDQVQVEARLNQLIAELERLNAQVNQQKKQLSDFLRRQYIHGDNDRIKLLLSGENPNRINRDMHYMSYISQTQARMIDALRVSLDEVEKNKQEAQEAKDELEQIAKEERLHKGNLEKEKKRRSAVLTELANKLHAQKKEAETLQKDEQRLSNLVASIVKAEQARQALEEKQRKERLAQEKAQREKNQIAGQNKKSGKIESAESTNSTNSTINKVEQTPIPNANDGVNFVKLKGQLRLPVKGELMAKFGTKRGDGPSWKGLFIKTVEGAEVKAIASGKVVFAEWLRGFGNMIMVDHGGQYWSLYSNNQAVLKHVGDVVKSGDVIASAGNSGGNEETGLYFEMRYQGRVFDPMTWVQK